jgi:hypothetical protein
MDCPTAIDLETRFPGQMEAIAELITDMGWDEKVTSEAEEGEDGCVFLFDRVTLNACNHAMTGVFWLDGTEWAFEVESGDWNGWVWRSVSAEGPIPEIDYKPTVFALQPNSTIVAQAVMANQGKSLVAKWDAFLERPEFKDLPRKYMYDRHFAPGIKTERYWKDKAATVGFELVDKDTANETRKRLMLPDVNPPSPAVDEKED